jgi:TolB protein
MANKLFTLSMFFVLIFATGCQRRRLVDEAVALRNGQVQSTDNPIAFSRFMGDYWQIWTMQPDCSNVKQVTMSLSDKRYSVWAKDNNQLLFRTNNNQVYNVNLDTGQENRILTSFGLIGGVASSPDGDKLLVVRFRTQPRDSANLWLTTLEGKDGTMLTRDVGLQYDPAWSPDGKKIVYILGHGYQTHELYIMDSDGKNKRRLTNNKALEVLPVFSPDGKTIAYSSNITGDFEIWLMNVDGSNSRQLTDSEGIDTRPYWSPDGSNMVFVSNRSDELQLWIMNNDGSNPRQLTKGAPSTDPVWRREWAR